MASSESREREQEALASPRAERGAGRTETSSFPGLTEEDDGGLPTPRRTLVTPPSAGRAPHLGGKHLPELVPCGQRRPRPWLRLLGRRLPRPLAPSFLSRAPGHRSPNSPGPTPWGSGAGEGLPGALRARTPSSVCFISARLLRDSRTRGTEENLNVATTPV